MGIFIHCSKYTNSLDCVHLYVVLLIGVGENEFVFLLLDFYAVL